MKAQLAMLFVMIGCCTNVVFLELLVKDDPGSGNLITFAQFLFIAVEGFMTTMRFGTKKPSIPASEYVILVSLFFVVSVTNNYALNFNISMPLHMIFRAGSLMANMVMGIVILKRRYTLMKYISVLMISLGITACTIASGQQVKSVAPTEPSQPTMDGNSTSSEESTSDGDVESDEMTHYLWWLVGISLLTFALFMSARMGIYQEVIYKKYGKHPREALFFTHALPLPGFLLLINDLSTHLGIASASPVISLPMFGALPRMWIYLIGNVITQYVCINSVFILTTECASLTVTLVVTLRKFFSLIFSIMYFKNPFTTAHWLGTALVFSGTFLFSDIPGMIRERKMASAKKEQERQQTKAKKKK